MADQRVNNDQDPWLREHIRAASKFSTTPDFRQRVLRDVSESNRAVARRTRRIATIVLLSGVIIFTVAIVMMISMLSPTTTFRLPLEGSSAVDTAIGFVCAVVFGLATADWLDGYV